MVDFDSLLCPEKICAPRTPVKFCRWVEDKLRLIGENYELVREEVLLRKGLFKNFYEEVYPLYLFVHRMYLRRSGLHIIPNLDNRDFDAVIVDSLASPPLEQKIEITSAVDGYDWALRRELLLAEGIAPLWGPLSSSGTRRTGRCINAEIECIPHNTTLNNTFTLIKSAAKKKTGNERYGLNHLLIIVFDDIQWFRLENDRAALDDFVKNEILLSCNLNFKTLYILGLSGKLLIPFELQSRFAVTS